VSIRLGFDANEFRGKMNMRNVKIAPKPPKSELQKLKDYFKQRLIKKLRCIKKNIDIYESENKAESQLLILEKEYEAFDLLEKYKDLLK
jgi:hypothetical protein